MALLFYIPRMVWTTLNRQSGKIPAIYCLKLHRICLVSTATFRFMEVSYVDILVSFKIFTFIVRDQRSENHFNVDGFKTELRGTSKQRENSRPTYSTVSGSSTRFRRRTKPPDTGSAMQKTRRDLRHRFVFGGENDVFDQRYRSIFFAKPLPRP